jgi:hypothetical protein
MILEMISSPRIICQTPCAVEKRTATLICEANGIPPPQYSWFYEQVNLRLSLSSNLDRFVE